MEIQQDQQFRVLTQHAIGGVTVRDGKIVAVEPFVRQFMGKPLEELRRWAESEGGKVEPVA
jgi:hypothetical protein